jgi:signal transduction histidine kinase
MAEQRPRTGVRARLGRAFALQIALISVAVVAGVFAIAFIVSDVLSRRALEGEAAHFRQRSAEDPSHPLPDTDNMTGYLARAGDETSVPTALRTEPPGFRRIDFGGGRPLLYVSDGPGGRLYLVFDQEQVSDLTLFFGVIPGAFVLLFIYALSFVTYRLSQRAVSPLVDLADRLEAYDPLAASGHHLDLDDLRGSGDAEVTTMIEALDRFTRRLEAFVARERQFTRDASHELRTPIAVLRACLDLLERDATRPAADRASIDRMRRTVTQMQSLIETLLLLAREDELRSVIEDVSINSVVAEQIDVLAELARETGNRVALETHSQLGVRAPSRLVAVALGNLLRNSLNYTRDGVVEVVIGARSVRISDSGSGMSPADLERVFEPFYRGESGASNSGSSGGFGLGLAIVRRLVLQFGWSLTVASEVGKGTRVDVDFAPPAGDSGVHVGPWVGTNIA